MSNFCRKKWPHQWLRQRKRGAKSRTPNQGREYICYTAITRNYYLEMHRKDIIFMQQVLQYNCLFSSKQDLWSIASFIVNNHGKPSYLPWAKTKWKMGNSDDSRSNDCYHSVCTQTLSKTTFSSSLNSYGTEEFGVMKNCSFYTGITRTRLLVSDLVRKWWGQVMFLILLLCGLVIPPPNLAHLDSHWCHMGKVGMHWSSVHYFAFILLKHEWLPDTL